MTLSTDRNLQPILPTEDEAALARASYQKLVSLIQLQEAYLTIKAMQNDSKEESVTIPAEAFRLFLEILAQMGQGNAVKVQPIRQELHLYEAADILGVSRSYVVSLLESGEIPYWIEGTVYRMRYHDVIDYKNRNDTERMKVLDELAAQAQELDMGY